MRELKELLTVVSNEKIAVNTYKMVLSGCTKEITVPGQFINIALDGFYLRRPISVCDWDENTVTIIYKAVGNGTELMATLKAGAQLDTLMGLGNGFDTSKSGNAPLLIGGGAGVPPMYALAKKLISEGKKPVVILGFNTESEVFFAEEFKALGIETYVSTADGSVGTKGFVTDVIAKLEGYTYFYTCGPEPMLKAIYNATEASGQLSFEERMGCGFGACMGCSCKTKYGNKRICKDGPVLEKEEIIW
ncbi:MAG: dihydroorotate dehydrogenase electron transfer subunit [Clostridia bacterium]|nr:dihydroorotate dehydrogenase electron transfer subunit [Clostridia bacterium]